MRISDGSSDVCSADLGTSAYFQEEITRWMTPEVRSVPADPASGFVAATEWLKREVPGGSEWSIYSTGKRAAGLQLYWVNGPDAPADAPTSTRLDGTGTKGFAREPLGGRAEEHTSELQPLMRTSYAVFC